MAWVAPNRVPLPAAMEQGSAVGDYVGGHTLRHTHLIDHCGRSHPSTSAGPNPSGRHAISTGTEETPETSSFSVHAVSPLLARNCETRENSWGGIPWSNKAFEVAKPVGDRTSVDTAATQQVPKPNPLPAPSECVILHGTVLQRDLYHVSHNIDPLEDRSHAGLIRLHGKASLKAQRRSRAVARNAALRKHLVGAPSKIFQTLRWKSFRFCGE